MRLFVIAGESSGDLHASNVLAELRLLNPELELKGMGGAMMESRGVQIIKRYEGLNFMGFWEVLKNIGTVLKAMNYIKKEILNFKPDAVLLIDYPAFNLRIASFCKKHNIKVIYYISPQIWAWKQSRIHQIKKNIDLMLVILPFEEKFYERWNKKVVYVGHPLLDAIQQFKISQRDSLQFKKPVIAILPGSRRGEISNMLPVMLKAVKKYIHEYQIIIAAAPSIELSFYEEFVQDVDVKILQHQTYHILNTAHAALVTSGTATLETALFHVPQVVCYKGSSISYHIAKQLIHVKYISLVNLILDRPVVTELIQHDMNSDRLQNELDFILNEGRLLQLSAYQDLEKILGQHGASKKAAMRIHTFLQLKQ
jgi:lipid-A-disaccharide synthase